MDDRQAVPPNEVASKQAVLRHGDVGQSPVYKGVDYGSATTPYERKAMVLNKAMQDVGMGRYQWSLFLFIGFGRFVDILWQSVQSLILPAIAKEFKFKAPLVTLGQNVGLLVGAVFGGFGSDIWGRKNSFNYTLFIMGIFAIAAGGSQNYIALSSLSAAGSFGSGGNLSVGTAILLEFVPATHQYLLTVLSIWKASGQLFASLIAWPLLAKISCSQPSPSSATHVPCTSAQNKGWRYLLYITGALTLLLWVIRFFCFALHESPKYLMGKERLEDAVEVVRKVAHANGRESSLVARDLEVTEVIGDGVEMFLEEVKREETKEVGKKEEEVEEEVQAEQAEGVQGERGISTDLVWGHVKSLFATREKAYLMCLLITIHGLNGLGTSLYAPFLTYFLSTRGVEFGDGSTYTTYRNRVIISLIGVPGATISGYMVELEILGRRRTLSIFTVLTGVFILTSITSRTSNALLGWNCAYGFTNSIMYGVLPAITPELLPTKDRGTGDALTQAAMKFFGVMAPIIAMYADLSTSVPIYISGSVLLVCGVLVLLLPRETRGTAAL